VRNIFPLSPTAIADVEFKATTSLRSDSVEINAESQPVSISSSEGVIGLVRITKNSRENKNIGTINPLSGRLLKVNLGNCMTRTEELCFKRYTLTLYVLYRQF
ncbi:MAG: hypothetical protein QF371_10450, partial [Flavobacteriales bacterium]|nr:hypothetical protein [Flavobacteriales bacterium]